MYIHVHIPYYNYPYYNSKFVKLLNKEKMSSSKTCKKSILIGYCKCRKPVEANLAERITIKCGREIIIDKTPKTTISSNCSTIWL